MVYNIEVSFNVLKCGSVTELQNSLKSYAEECECQQVYEDYEFENKTQFQRRHCIISTTFELTNITGLNNFLKFVRKNKGLYLESIYNNETNSMLYASQYYITQKMNKKLAKEFIFEKRKRSYSEDETMILNSIKN
jgi:hypothetical protein